MLHGGYINQYPGGFKIQTSILRKPVYLLEQANKVFRTRSILDMELRRAPTTEEIAERSGNKVQNVKRILESHKLALSIDSPVDESGHTLVELIEDSVFPLPDWSINKVGASSKDIGIPFGTLSERAGNNKDEVRISYRGCLYPRGNS